MNSGPKNTKDILNVLSDEYSQLQNAIETSSDPLFTKAKIDTMAINQSIKDTLSTRQEKLLQATEDFFDKHGAMVIYDLAKTLRWVHDSYKKHTKNSLKIEKVGKDIYILEGLLISLGEAEMGGWESVQKSLRENKMLDDENIMEDEDLAL